MNLDLEFIKKQVTSIITPIIFTNLNNDETIIINKHGFVDFKAKGHHNHFNIKTTHWIYTPIL